MCVRASDADPTGRVMHNCGICATVATLPPHISGRADFVTRGNAPVAHPGMPHRSNLLPMDFTNTSLAWDRPLTSYSKVQQVVAPLLRNRHFQIDKEIEQKEYLDVGCGPNTHGHFINLDYSWHPDIDICWDVTKGLPLNDRSVSGVFTEHCLEHLSFEAVDFVLSEFYRVLKPEGALRIVVPDGELYLTRYTELVNGGEGASLPYSEGDEYEGIYSPIMSVNRIFRCHGHQFIYDFATFRQLLKKNRFTQIEKKSYQSGRDPELLIDTESRAVESLYVEATKPQSAA